MHFYVLRRAIRRISKAWYKPSAFLIEFKVKEDLLGPTILAFLYFSLSSIYSMIVQTSKEYAIVQIISNGLLYLLEFILTPFVLLLLISMLRVKINLKRDCILIWYSFSIRVIFYLIIIFLAILFVFVIKNQIINIVIQIMFVISITWSLMLQYYFLREEKKIYSIILLFLILTTWITVLFITGIVGFALGRFGIFPSS